MIVKYVRVSSDTQNTERQEQTEYPIYRDICSGSEPFENRKDGKRLLKDCKAGKISKIHVHSVDRLGRDAYNIQTTANTLNNLKVCIYVEDLGLSSLLPTGEVNSMFKLITDLLANIAEMERKSIRQRQLEGIRLAKKRGVFSKPRDRAKLSNIKMLERNEKIVTCLKAGMSLNQTKIATDKSIPTIIKVKKILKEFEQSETP